MAESGNEAETRDLILDCIRIYNAAAKTADDDPISEVDPADDLPNLVSHFRTSYASERYLEATKNLILAIMEAAYLYPGGGVFHDGSLYLVYIDPATGDDKDEDTGEWSEWTVPYEVVTAEEMVYRLNVIPETNLVNLDAKPVVFD